MWKVMVVDDDYLVRQGFIRIMPWEEFGMEVACEAADGEEALEKLARHEVDLLITDLAMPVMSGIELMKRVKESYPHIFMVVLTFHHEFDLVRDALRLGAIDYITKVELEEDQMAPILQRIADRIRQNAAASASLADGGAQRFADDEADTLVRADENGLHWSLIGAEDEDGGCRMEAHVPEQRHPFDQVRVRWTGVKGMEKKELLHKLYLYGEHALFYCMEDGVRHYVLPAERLAAAKAPSKDAVVQLGLDWSGLGWMTDDASFSRLLARTSALALPAAQLEQMLYMAMEEWSKVFGAELFRFDDTGRPQTWQGWTRWLEDIRQRIQGKTGKQVYSLEVVSCIFKAVDVIKQELNSDLQLADLARKVGMSRSYFSRCFRDIVGVTFQDYLRDLRIQRAKTLLAQTNKSVSWVASESGYPNERYFSRVFREATGKLPRDYRKEHRKVTKRLL